MKKVICMLFLVGSVACSTEDSPEDARSGNAALKSTASDDSEAANLANPFDDRGVAYLQLADYYEALDTKPSGNTAIIDALEAIAVSLNISSQEYDPEVSQGIHEIKQLSASQPQTVLEGLNISSEGRGHLRAVLNELKALKDQEAGYDAVYNALVNREQSILESSLVLKDKETLLSTLSILRYSVYSKSRRKRKDRDWELSVGNVMATSYGAVSSRPNAIISGVASEYIN
ncbi:hypothetical protein AMR72_00050 [Flavobacterium psychrophilum]|nr:hypothetical protein AMR72_00050 [Flavobacterium psychrophilum]AOE51048.1 hypothetical protein ALW18_00050 [Flavobacterium psychrophilum]